MLISPSIWLTKLGFSKVSKSNLFEVWGLLGEGLLHLDIEPQCGWLQYSSTDTCSSDLPVRSLPNLYFAVLSPKRHLLLVLCHLDLYPMIMYSGCL